MDNQQPTENNADLDTNLPQQDVQEPIINEPKKSKLKSLLRPTNLLIFGIILVLVIVGIAAVNNNTKNSEILKSANQVVITITDQGFVPNTVVVSKDTNVVWVNKDNKPHQVIAEPYPTGSSLPGLNSQGDILPSEQYGYIFDKDGEYKYTDGADPIKNKGVVQVK